MQAQSWGAGLALRGLSDSGCIFKIEVAPRRQAACPRQGLDGTLAGWEDGSLQFANL